MLDTLPVNYHDTQPRMWNRVSHHRTCLVCRQPLLRKHLYQGAPRKNVFHVLSMSERDLAHEMSVNPVDGRIVCTCTAGYYAAAAGKSAWCEAHLLQALELAREEVEHGTGIDMRIPAALERRWCEVRIAKAARRRAREEAREAAQSATVVESTPWDFDNAPPEWDEGEDAWAGPEEEEVSAPEPLPAPQPQKRKPILEDLFRNVA